MERIQTQGLHHITLVGADRQTSIDFWEGVLGMPFVFEQPNLDNAAESHIYFDPGDGRLITVFTQRGPQADPAPHADRTRLRAPHRVQCLARDVQRGAASGSNERGIRNTGLRDRQIFDAVYFEDPLGPADRAFLLEIRAAGRASAIPTCCTRRIICASRAATGRSTKSHHRRRDRDAGARARPRACRPTARPKNPTAEADLRPTVNNQLNQGGNHVRDQTPCDQAERQQHERARVRARRQARLRRGRRLRQDAQRRVRRQESRAFSRRWSRPTICPRA